MLPVMLEISTIPIAVIGNSERAVRRIELLEEAGAKHITVFAHAPVAALEEIAAARLVRGVAEAEMLKAYKLLFVVDLEEKEAAPLATKAREFGLLVHVEDQKPWCDFFFPSILRRGELVIAVSTEGKSPSLARSIKKKLAAWFDESWRERVKELADKRDAWRNEGKGMEEVAEMSETWIKERKWL